jgi:DNA polymerase-3 subunit alpha
MASDRDSGMGSLFDGAAAPTLRAPKLPTLADWDSLARLRREFEAIGFYLSAHPLDGYERPLARLGVVSSAGLSGAAAANLGGGSTRYRMAGIVVARQERTARSGNRFAFVQLSDAAGVFEVTLFSETLAVARPLLEPGTAVLVTVDVQQQGDDLRLTAQHVAALEQEVAQAAEGVRVFVNEAGPVDGLCSTLQRVGRGRGRVSVVVALDRAREVEIVLPGGWAMSASGRAAIKAIPGVVDVHDL